MAEIKTGVTLSLKDIFSQAMNKAAGAAGGFANKTLGAIDKVDKAVSGTNAKLAALGVTLSVGVAAKGIIEMDHKMTRLGISAGASSEEISKLKQAIFETAQTPDIKVDSSSILNGLDVIINKTNDLKYAEDNIRNIGLAIQATGESGESIGNVFSEFQRFKYTSEQITSLMDDLIAQSNEGSFSLAEFAKVAPQIFSSYSAIGTAPENIKKANAALQIINAGTKSPTKAVASFNAAMEEIADPEKQKNLRRLGIRVRDSAGNFRDFNDIMFDIAEKSENARYADYINKTFSASSMQAIRSYISHGERMYENLFNLGNTTGLLQKQSAAMAGTLQSNIQNLQTAFNKFANSNLTKPLSNLTELLNKLSEDPERLKKVFTGIAVGIGAITAVKGIAGISRLVGSLLQLKGGNINLGSLSMATAMPVYVTNWGGGQGIPGMGQSVPALGNPAPKASSPKIKASTAIKAGLAVSAIAGTAKFFHDRAKEVHSQALTKVDPAIPGVSNYYNLNPKARKKLWEEYTAKTGKTQNDFLPETPLDQASLPRWMQTPVFLSNLEKKVSTARGEGIGSAISDDNKKQSSVNHGNRMLSADLPSYITQSKANITPQRVELGHADINLNIDLSGDRPAVTAVMQNNTMPALFNTGSRVMQRRGGL